ncbi:DUF2382 domain-containing protein [Jeotgalibaca sp. A122]|uniref:DUF2382 domain-containing protein n=1 Tax=Jeotgalibaca sp. A122 TaxID=3457322 RepID=UPI003FD61C67
MNRHVEGSYETVTQAFDAVERLKEQGYGRNDIYIVANDTVRDQIPYTLNAEVSTDNDLGGTDEERSLWEKIKDAFTFDDAYEHNYNTPDYNVDNDPLSSYRDDLDRGNILVLVDKDAATTHTGVLSDQTDTTFRDDTETDRLHDEETLKLKEERLDVHTEEVQTGDVRLQKHVTEETETVDVPVSHDEVTIERRRVTNPDSTNESIHEFDDSEEIVIPITEEQVDVSKHTNVVEEVVIRKDKVTENKKVTDTVRKEELEVEGDEHLHVKDENDDLI